MRMTREEAQNALTIIQQVVNKVHDNAILQHWSFVMLSVSVFHLMALLATQYFVSAKVFSIWPYIIVWGLYLVVNLTFNLVARQKMGGSMTYVERHIWGNGITYVIASIFIVCLDLHMLPLETAIRVLPSHYAVISGVSFAIVALIDARFFISTGTFMVAAGIVGVWPDYGYAILGVVWFLTLSVPGVILRRERKRALETKRHTANL